MAKEVRRYQLRRRDAEMEVYCNRLNVVANKRPKLDLDSSSDEEMSKKNLNKNAIAAFEEYGVQHRRSPKVEVVEQSGPPHKPIFWAEARLGSEVVCKEKGGSKHEARISAAERALQQLYKDKGKIPDEKGDVEEVDTSNPIPYKDPVAAVMEYAQSRKMAVEFVQLSQSGPPHMPVFTMEARVGDEPYHQVVGSSIKETKKKAACVVLNTLKTGGELQKLFPDTEVLSSAQQKSKASLALPGKNPVCVLNEYAQKHCVKIQFISKQSGPSHKPVFSVSAILGDEEFLPVEANSKKEGNVQAAAAVLAILENKGLYKSPSTEPIKKELVHAVSRADKIASVAMRKVEDLLLQTPESLVGRKVFAAIIMSNDSNDEKQVISVGTGNRCIRGSLLCDRGSKVHDSHAEILARRGFKRFLYSLVKSGDQKYIQRRSSSDQKYSFRKGLSFHLYISTAPCGDGALFTHSDQMAVGAVSGDSHTPVFFNRRTQGLLRAKQENGEGTIPIDGNMECQTFDGVQQGDRLRIMSCSDKICMWNVVGLQGSLLSNLFDPIYLDSVTLGTLYNPGHLSRALCCRIDYNTTQLTNDLRQPFAVKHPDVGVSSTFDSTRAVERARSLSINWSYNDAEPEVTDGTTGLKTRTMNQRESPSRLCKRNLLHLYQQITNVPGAQQMTYKQLKLTAIDYHQAKIAFKARMSDQGYGPWISMPTEVDRF